jgi:hypothetical protein
MIEPKSVETLGKDECGTKKNPWKTLRDIGVESRRREEGATKELNCRSIKQ